MTDELECNSLKVAGKKLKENAKAQNLPEQNRQERLRDLSYLFSFVLGKKVPGYK